MLVVVLQAALMLLAEQLAAGVQVSESHRTQLPFWAGFLLGVGTMLYAVLWQMMYLGFLKTAAVEGPRPQPPAELVRSGRPYFWRILFFQILLGCVLFFVNGVLVGAGGAIFWKGRPFPEIPEWFMQVCGLAAILIVLKPMLLVPARMLVYDDSTYQAIAGMRTCKIGRLDSLLKLTILGLGVVLVIMLLASAIPQKTPAYYVFLGLHHIVFSLVFLTPTLMAVLWMQEQLEAAQHEEENDA